MSFIAFLFLWVFYDSYTNYYNVHFKTRIHSKNTPDIIPNQNNNQNPDLNRSNNSENITNNNDNNSSDTLPVIQDNYPNNTNIGLDKNTFGENPLGKKTIVDSIIDTTLPELKNMYPNKENNALSNITDNIFRKQLKKMETNNKE
jgi:hypothetical protein